MRSPHKVVVLSFLMVTLVAFGRVYAQRTSGSISGLVTDPSGLAIPGAKITVRDVGTGVATNVVANGSGFYVASDLIPGTYAVTVRAKGFRQFNRTNVVITVGSLVRVDVSLRVGATTQVVSVRSSPAVLQTEKANVGDVISTRILQGLPILNRNVSKLVQILPGALVGGSAFIGEDPGSDTNGFVNGQGGGNNAHLLNGIDDTETIQGAAMINPPIDALQEVKVETNSYDAQYGQVAGAVFEASTKSGTNQYHGSAFEYVQNNDMFARDPFTQSTTNVAPWRWNEFGGTIGGPIKKGKLFFFSDYQGVRSRQGSTMLLSLPTPAMRQGDFSSVTSLYPVYNPATGDENGVGRVLFPNNVIPSASLDPVALKLLAMLPGPNTVGPSPYINNFTASGSFTSDTDEADERVDYDINANTRMFGTYTFMRSIYDSPPVFGVVLGGPGFGPQAEIGGTRTQNVSYTLSHSFGPSMLGDFRFGVSRFRSNLAQTDIGLETAKQVGITGINLGTALTDGLPELSWGGPVVDDFFLGNPYSNFYELEQQISYATDWTKVAGSHTFEWGADLRPKVSLQRIDKSLRGSYGFGQYTTGSPVSSSTGIGFASFLLGVDDSFSRGAYLNLPHEYQDRYAAYGQDLWRVNKKLALTLGVRWEYYSPTYSAGRGNEVNFDFATGDMVFANIGPYNKYAGVKPDYKDFGPRAGIAYTITPDTVFRAGYAKTYMINTDGANFGTYCCQWPIDQNQDITSTTNYNTIFSMEQGPPPASTVIPPIPSTGALAVPNGEFVLGRAFNDPTSNLQSWNATLEHQFTPSLTASIAYLGNAGRDLWYTGHNANAPSPGPGPFCSREVYCRLNGLSQWIDVRDDNGNSVFNSMQVQVNKRFAQGYEFMASYTYQKTINDGWTDEFNREAYHSLNGSTQWLTLSHVVNLPFGPGHFIGGQTKGVTAALISGWRLSGIWQFQAGDLLSPGMNENTLNVTNWGSGQLPNCSGNPNISNPTQTGWFNDSVFSVPPPYTLGDCGLNSIRGPRWWDPDLSLARNFRITERVQLGFEWDWFNAFNVADLGNPDTTIDDPAGAVGHIFDVHHTMRRTQLGLHLNF